MTQVNLDDAKTRLSRLGDCAAAGEDVAQTRVDDPTRVREGAAFRAHDVRLFGADPAA